MYRTFKFARSFARCPTSSPPFIPGMTTSVSTRSIVSLCDPIQRMASAALLASITVYPFIFRNSRVMRRTASSSSTTRIRSLPCRDETTGFTVSITSTGSSTRKIDFDHRSNAHFTRNIDATAALVHGTVDRCQTEPSSFVCVLGREKRFEEMGLGFLVHAVAGVAYGKHRVSPGLHSGVLAAPRRVQIGICSLNRQIAAEGHGVPCVKNQIHDDLFQLGGIGLHTPEFWFKMYVQVDVLAQNGWQ